MTASRFTRLRISYLIAGFAIAAAVSAGAAQAQQQTAAPSSGPEGGIVVIGEGSISAAPDYAEVNGGVTTRAKSVKEATDADSKLMAAITSALQDAGIAAKDIQTSRFSIQPVYTPADPQNESKLAGYSVSNQVNVTIRDIGKAGDTLDRLATAGVTNVGNIELLHSDPSKPRRGGHRRQTQGGNLCESIRYRAGPRGVDYGRCRAGVADADDGAHGGRRVCGADANLCWRGRIACANYSWLRHRQLTSFASSRAL